VPKEKLTEYKNISDECEKIGFFSENILINLGSLPDIDLINDFKKNCEMMMASEDNSIGSVKMNIFIG
jgi:hypothetical protein